MGDSHGDLPASKKRDAERQISKDDREPDDDGPEPEMGTFKKASDEVLAARRIVKVRRTQTSAASSNPFAALRMVPPSESSVDVNNTSAQIDNPGDKTTGKDVTDAKDGKSEECKGTKCGTLIDEPNGIESGKKVEQQTDISTVKDTDEVKTDAVEGKTQSEAEKDAENGEKHIEEKGGEEAAEADKKLTEKRPSGEEAGCGNTCEGEAENEKLVSDSKDADAAKPAASLSSFQQLCSSQNAFTGIVGTGFGTSSFSFGSIPKEGPTFGASSGSIFGFKSGNTSPPSFGVGGSSNGSAWKSSISSSPDVTKSAVASMQEVPIETGEENEKAVFTADAMLYEYFDGGWKERGKGELKLNVSLSSPEKARLVMRARGNYRLILNASLYPDMTLASMEKKGITFACINSSGEGKNALATFALKFKDSSFVEEFRGAVEAHKGKKAVALNTPENSPKASDD